MVVERAWNYISLLLYLNALESWPRYKRRTSVRSALQCVPLASSHRLEQTFSC